MATDRYAIESTSRMQVAEFPKGWVPHPRPESPAGFTKHTFVLPEHQTRLSQVVNKHPRDAHIRFDEEPHLYYVDGIVCTRSVTGLVHLHCQEFVESEGIATMKRGKNWPRSRYAKEDPIEWRIVACQMALQAVQLEKKQSGCIPATMADAVDGLNIETAVDPPFNWDRCCTHFKTVKRENKWTETFADEDMLQWVHKVAFTDAQIKQAWDDKREEACARGTWFHLQCELWLNCDPCYLEWQEMALFLKYVKCHLEPMGVRVFRTELEVWDADIDLAGSVDFVGIYTTGPNKGKLFIADWKRSENLRNKKQHVMGLQMQAPLDYLPDSSLMHYAVQLSAYRWIIEKNYGYQVGDLEVVCCHTDNGESPYIARVPYLKPEIEFLMAQQAWELCDKIATQRLGLQDVDDVDAHVTNTAERLQRATQGLVGRTAPRLEEIEI